MKDTYVNIKKDPYSDRGFYVCVTQDGMEYLHRDGKIHLGVTDHINSKSGDGFWSTHEEATMAYQEYIKDKNAK